MVICIHFNRGYKLNLLIYCHKLEFLSRCNLCSYSQHWMKEAGIHYNALNYNDIVGLLGMVFGISIMASKISRCRPPISSCRTTQMSIVVLLSPSCTTMSVSLRKTVAPAVRVGHRHSEQPRDYSGGTSVCIQIKCLCFK